MSSNSQKPSPKELLEELESIRNSLLEDSAALEAAEEEMKKEQPEHEEPLEMSATREQPVIEAEIAEDEEYDYLLDIPETTGKIPGEDTVEHPDQDKNDGDEEHKDGEDYAADDDAPDIYADDGIEIASSEQSSVLPGQQSLFAEEDNTAREKTREHDAKAVNAKQVESARLKPKARKENPFLPKHIKDRLEKEKSLYQQEIDAASKLHGVFQAKEQSAHQHLIDDLVALYLPQIEMELRRRLKEQLDKDGGI